jgi:hypothetical protein
VGQNRSKSRQCAPHQSQQQVTSWSVLSDNFSPRCKHDDTAWRWRYSRVTKPKQISLTTRTPTAFTASIYNHIGVLGSSFLHHSCDMKKSIQSLMPSLTGRYNRIVVRVSLHRSIAFNGGVEHNDVLLRLPDFTVMYRHKPGRLYTDHKHTERDENTPYPRPTPMRSVIQEMKWEKHAFKQLSDKLQCVQLWQKTTLNSLFKIKGAQRKEWVWEVSLSRLPSVYIVTRSHPSQPCLGGNGNIPLKNSLLVLGWDQYALSC